MPHDCRHYIPVYIFDWFAIITLCSYISDDFYKCWYSTGIIILTVGILTRANYFYLAKKKRKINKKEWNMLRDYLSTASRVTFFTIWWCIWEEFQYVRMFKILRITNLRRHCTLLSAFISLSITHTHVSIYNIHACICTSEGTQLII